MLPQQRRTLPSAFFPSQSLFYFLRPVPGPCLWPGCVVNKVCVCRDRKETVIACWMDFLPAALLIMRAGMMQLSESPKIKPAQGETELCQKRTDELPTLLTLPQQHIQKPQFPQICHIWQVSRGVDHRRGESQVKFQI